MINPSDNWENLDRPILAVKKIGENGSVLSERNVAICTISGTLHSVGNRSHRFT